MSRRNRHKKKKLKIQKKINQFTPAAEAKADKPEVELEIAETETTAIPKPEIKPEESESIIDAPTRKLIGKDVRMIIFTLLGLAIILTAVKILSLKTGYIDNFGNWLYKITNIQTM